MMQRRPVQQHNHRHHNEDPNSRVLYELSSLVLALLRSAPPLPISDPPSTPPQLLSNSSTVSSSSSSSLLSRRPSTQISPSGFASLMLGISMTLILCGSVTFIIGFILLPWIIAFIMLLYVVGLVSAVSMLARAILFHLTSIASPPPSKDLPEWKLL